MRLDSQGFSAARTTADRATRKQVFDTFFGTFKTYESSLGSALAAKIQGDMFAAKARKYPNTPVSYTHLTLPTIYSV